MRGIIGIIALAVAVIGVVLPPDQVRGMTYRREKR
jgi:hypothetical protein